MRDSGFGFASRIRWVGQGNCFRRKSISTLHFPPNLAYRVPTMNSLLSALLLIFIFGSVIYITRNLE